MIAHDAGLKGGVGKGLTAATVPQLGQQGQEYKGELYSKLIGELNQELKFSVGNMLTESLGLGVPLTRRYTFSPTYPCDEAMM